MDTDTRPPKLATDEQPLTQENKNPGDAALSSSSSSSSTSSSLFLFREWLPLPTLEVIALFCILIFFVINYAWFNRYTGEKVGAPLGNTQSHWTENTCFNYKWRSAARWMYETERCYARYIAQKCHAKTNDNKNFKQCAHKWITKTMPTKDGWTDDDKLWLQPALLRSFSLEKGKPQGKRTKLSTTNNVRIDSYVP
jgi:hypothetical protein